MKNISLLLFLFCSYHAFATDSVTLKITRIGKKGPYKDWVFRITIQNNGYDLFKVPDTSRMRRTNEEGYPDYLVSFFEVKSRKRYSYIEIEGKRSGYGIDSCSLYCCNCVSLRKGEVISFEVRLLKGLPVRPGKYRMRLYMSTPVMEEWPSGHFAEYVSNYLFFRVRD